MVYRCALDAKPIVRAIGIASHGPAAVEKFLVGNLWCLHLYRYRSRIKIGADSFEIYPGCIGITPPSAESSYVFSERSTHGYIHFEAPGEVLQDLSPMIRMGDTFASAWTQFENAIGVFPIEPLRAEIKVWDLLWEHAERTAQSGTSTTPLHPAVNQALRIMEAKMSEPISITALAETVGLSHNHLTRLFQKHLGRTIVGHLIERRLMRAEHLLRHSNMPVKQVASNVGMNDLQAFNKAFRSRYGVSPRELRRNPPGIP